MSTEAAGPSGRVTAAKRSGLEELNSLMMSSYFAANIVLTSLYIVLREVYQVRPIRREMLIIGEINDFNSWERYMAFLCLGYAFFRAVKARSRAASIQAVLSYTQLFVAVMAFVCSPILLAYFLVVYVLIYLVLPQPSCTALHERWEHLTPGALADDVIRGSASGDTAWVVLLTASWHPDCRALSWEMADLAARYANDRLRFGMVDVGEYTKLAHKMGVELSPVSSQLPCVLLYEKGEEVMRIPRKQGSNIWGLNWRTKELVRSMELDSRYARSMQKAEDKKGK